MACGQGADGAAAMLTIAERQQRADPTGHPHLRFRQLVLPCEQLAGPFSAVVSNSLLHHLHDPGVFWDSVRRLVAPGSCIYVRDLRRPESDSELEALVHRHAASAPELVRRDYAHSLRAAFTRTEVMGQLETAGLQELNILELEDRYLEIQGRLG
jgi:trans-aconitate 2-methyltransferase